MHEFSWDSLWFMPQELIILVFMAKHHRVFKFTSIFASHVHDLHKKLTKEIEENNSKDGI